MLTDKYTDKKIELRARVFNLLGTVGIFAGFIFAAASAVTGTGITNIALNLMSSAAAIALIYYANRSGRFHLCYVITIIVVFIAFFPIMFFTGGAYHGGMPSFFIFALIFTVFMLDGPEMYFFAFFEAVMYIGICAYVYYRPESASFFENERDAVKDIVIGFVGSSVLLSFALLKILQVYRDAQRELALKNAELELVDIRKTEFLGDIAHELKTPIAAIMGIAQNSRRQMAEGVGADSLIQDMKALASEAGRMGLLVEQILNATRIDEGLMSLNIRETSIEEIIQTTINSYYPLLKKNSNNLVLKPCEDLPGILADSDRISQVLVNLLQNAIRHTNGGTIAVSAEQAENFVKITITDTGEGIEPERLPVIFERFKSRDSAKKRAPNDTGAGLGLYICRHIVEAHGGAIEIASEIGAGTSVSFTIPACL
jgi:signal transduction histidine kinase